MSLSEDTKPSPVAGRFRDILGSGFFLPQVLVFFWNSRKLQSKDTGCALLHIHGWT